MARQVRDTRLETREARKKLKVGAEPYWRVLDKGMHLGYRRRSNGGSWIARRYTEEGKYAKKKLGAADDFQDADGIKTLDFKQAQELARAWQKAEIRIERGLDPKRDGAYTVDDAIADYLEHYKVEGKGLRTAMSAANTHILPELGKAHLDRLTTKRITDWHKELAERAPLLRSSKFATELNRRKNKVSGDAIRQRRASANRILTVLKAALNYAWREGHVASDTAWRKVRPFKSVDAPVVRYLTELECIRLINACQGEFRTLVQAAIFTGCRYSELVRLVMSDFNIESGTVLIRMSKAGKARHVVLTEEASDFFRRIATGKRGSDILFTHDDGSVWGESHQSRPLALACKQASISPAISFHVLRHTHGSMLAMKGVPMPVIAKQLGHADTRMTERHYAHLSPSYVADTIRQHFPVLGMAQATNVVPLSAKT